MTSPGYVDPSLLQADYDFDTAHANGEIFDPKLPEEEYGDLFAHLDFNHELLENGLYHGKSGFNSIELSNGPNSPGTGPELSAQATLGSTETRESQSSGDAVAHEPQPTTDFSDFSLLWNELPFHDAPFCLTDLAPNVSDDNQHQDFPFVDEGATGLEQNATRLDENQRSLVQEEVRKLMCLPTNKSEDAGEDFAQKVVDGIVAKLSSLHLPQVFGPQEPQDGEPPLAGHVGRSGHDSDGGRSWEEQDNSEEFYDEMQRILEILTYSADGPVFVTEPLPPRKRRLVHAIAHIKYLNHMTLDQTGDRRILVSKNSIRCVEDPTGKRKCWNRRSGPFTKDLDPTCLIFTFESRVSKAHGLYLLAKSNLPLPLVWEELLDSRRPNSTKYAVTFDNPSTAATVWQHISLSRYLRSVYLEVGYRTQDVSESQPLGQDRAHSPRSTTNRGRPQRRRPSFQHFSSIDADEYGSSASGVSSKRSFSVYRSDATIDNDGAPLWSKDDRDVGERSDDSEPTSDIANILKRPSSRPENVPRPEVGHNPTPARAQNTMDPSEPLEYFNGDPQPKRRRRLPRLKGGYKCSEQGCDKVFDCSGDRAKHERYHAPESEYPHACQYCDRRFINKKDATRHEKVHLRKWLPGK